MTQFRDPQVRKDNQNKTAETNKESHWPPITFEIPGDFLVNGIDEKKLQKHGMPTFFTFRVFLLYLILPVGTNDATNKTSRKVRNNLLILKCNILKQFPNCRIVLSKPTTQIDLGKANLSKHKQISVNLNFRFRGY